MTSEILDWSLNLCSPLPVMHRFALACSTLWSDCALCLQGFKPTSGTIERVKFQSTSSVWGYFSVGANGGIHEYADSQFGHLFASGATREAARKNLVLALKEIEVGGIFVCRR